MRTDLSSVIRGDSLALTLNMTDGDGLAVVGLAGRTLTMTIKQSPDDTDAEAVAQEVSVIPDDVDTTAGRVYVSMPAEKTALLEPNQRYHYDVQMTYDTTVMTLLLGRLRVIADVTHTGAV